MPAKTDKLRIGKKNDGRRRVSDDLRAQIKMMYEQGKSIRALARETGVSRRLIGFIVDDERYQAHLERNKRTQHWKKYYDKDKRREYMRNYRAKLKRVGQEPATLAAQQQSNQRDHEAA